MNKRINGSHCLRTRVEAACREERTHQSLEEVSFQGERNRRILVEASYREERTLRNQGEAAAGTVAAVGTVAVAAAEEGVAGTVVVVVVVVGVVTAFSAAEVLAQSSSLAVGFVALEDWNERSQEEEQSQGEGVRNQVEGLQTSGA